MTTVSDKETAIRYHKEITRESVKPLAIYTDRSGINEKVGVAAVAPELHMRRDVAFTVCTCRRATRNLDGIKDGLRGNWE
jgi:hypothetical protein